MYGGMFSIQPLLTQRCPNCGSLYEYSVRKNSMGLNAPTAFFCSECGDLVATWPHDEIRVYIFVASSSRADELVANSLSH